FRSIHLLPLHVIFHFSSARTQFYQCLGTSYYACMNLFNILDTSDPDFVNAFDYTRTFLGLEFMCNAGFEGEFRV
ncbi:hypothetical protein ANCCAN_06347, partial [Ancylostoma caninum]